jgi:DNA helicase-2/ATP-dependent DNA helicase PcrA
MADNAFSFGSLKPNGGARPADTTRAGTPQRDAPAKFAFNDQQKDAITKVLGAFAVNAGAGSGKTRVITERVGRLIESGQTSHNRVLILTFTVKAAEEFSTRMRERTGKTLPWACNFHRMCGRLIREFGFGWGANFVIADQSASDGLMKQCLLAVDPGSDPKTNLANTLKAMEAKRLAAHLGEDAPFAGFPMDEAIAQYEEALRARKTMDFDLMLYVVADGLRDDANLAKRIANLWDFVLVDEMQDTNTVQLEILKMIAPHGNIMGVGDMDQGIYAFRGAVPGNLLAFVQHFGAEVLPLEMNYRSMKEILDVANYVISKNPDRIPKRLRSARGPGGVVDIRRHEDHEAEALFVAESLRLAIRKGTPADRFAVLYRVNATSRAIESQLAKQGVPYRIRGGARFWDRLAVKDTLALAAILNGSADMAAWERAMTRPARGVGKVSLEKIAASVGRGMPIEDAMRAFAKASSGATGLRDLLSAVDDARALVSGKPSFRCLEAFLDLSGYNAHLQTAIRDPEERQERVENIAEALAVARRHANLEEFLDETALGTPTNGEAMAGEVTLSTVHSAKGLEWGIVHIIGCHQGGIPHKASLRDPAQIEEERRLMYVSITRAKDELHMHWADEVTAMDGETEKVVISQFLDGVADTLPVDTYHCRSQLPEMPAAKTSQPRPWDAWR